MKTYKYDDYKKELLSDESVKKEYDSLNDDFSLSKEIIQLRKEKNLTQKELAKEIGSSQPAIARLESGNYRNLSLSFLRKVANALDAVPEVHLKRKAQ